MVIVLKAPFQEEVILENVDPEGNPVPFPLQGIVFQVLDKQGKEVYRKTSGIEIFGANRNMMAIRFSPEETETLASRKQGMSFSIYTETGNHIASGVILVYQVATRD